MCSSIKLWTLKTPLLGQLVQRNTRSKKQERCFLCGPHRDRCKVATSAPMDGLANHKLGTPTDTHAKIEALCFLCVVRAEKIFSSVGQVIEREWEWSEPSAVKEGFIWRLIVSSYNWLWLRMIVKEVVNKSNHPIQNPLWLVTKIHSMLQFVKADRLATYFHCGILLGSFNCEDGGDMFFRNVF
jgi:hypothetical protein